MEKKKKRLIIIDSNSIIHRAYHALPPLTTKKGELVSAVYGFLLVFLKVIREFQPDYIAACFDVPGPTFRHKKFKEYKAKRPPTPKELYQQIPKVKEILKAFQVQVFEKESFEADDLIGTIARLAPKKFTPYRNEVSGAEQVLPGIETIILSGDLDTLQLVNPQTKVYFLRKGVKDVVLYDVAEVEKKYGISPSQLLDFKALRGDPSDNIPGVAGIGEKTAIKLIKKFKNIENLYEQLEEQNRDIEELKPKLRNLLLSQKKQAFLSKNLVQIRNNVPIGFEFKKCQFGNFNRKNLESLLLNFEFYSLIKKLSNPQNDSAVIEQNLKLW
ncbi:MAG: hypothetical protein CO144_01875 [Candidatus Nealsonbacteria bacterium CG_4_9_14_3_um_filter_35_11]|uniref:5'-3' exonuclease domain-containing protein n=2 Tax=Candidatus Nealsoniibacteriota TaxID=1817911 RepID=A0A2M7DAX6_9BACT|nr:MAG: hypothetical protein COV62_01785 [Candidatus Nealsonbacteria bacterium CG11_big_fil_rev_8_21_14_0_20_35_11]PIV45625.1 MAG: hypothetical protein COS24_01275 [Candidatus Nealsonbacteria bacterium CG02_land_8_20_14_3_00_34_20]PIW92410.1 MAG: hypothetical protein COZ88_02265 [Candidatus Nealsonbacteria bacterium CG_4_8_14_3_um_filter_34_13]PIZ89941.1 MAG: hypothetical protein COX88_01045 [Candidatus Nealsonbacteria bacterium CG_4_10_14_0_2_um_filter_35_20]PJA84401.1 MAG: hypothetical protei